MAKGADNPFNCSVQSAACMTLPVAVLQKALDTRINVLLKDGRILEGKLAGFDDHLNLVLEEAMENHEGEQRRLGTLILRGNNVITIAQP